MLDMTGLDIYQNHKATNLDWNGTIPKHWNVIPITKYASRVDYRGKTPNKVEEGIFLVTTKNIKDGQLDYDISQEFIAENEYKSVMSRGYPSIGDLLFTMEAPLGNVAIVNKPMIAIAQRIIKFRFKSALSPKFACYSMQSVFFQSLSQKEGTGSTAIGIKASKLSRLKLIAPSLKEQAYIINFLDQKTKQIVQAITTKEKQIALFKERKQILIQNAITRGLDPDAPMRDSGVDWVGQVPKHWQVKRAKYLFNEVDERSIDGKEELLSVSHMTGVTPRSEKNVTMFMSEDYTGSKTCQKGDLVFNIMWTWMGALGVSDRGGIVSSSYGIFRQQQLGLFNPKYLENLLKTTGYIDHYNKVSTGLHSSRLRFYGHMFFSMELGFPDRKEQDDIIDYINAEASAINKAIDIQQQQIEKLKEYKATLINSAVTGKIRVPGVEDISAQAKEAECTP